MDRPGRDDQTGGKHLQNAWTAPVSPAGQSGVYIYIRDSSVFDSINV